MSSLCVGSKGPPCRVLSGVWRGTCHTRFATVAAVRRPYSTQRGVLDAMADGTKDYYILDEHSLHSVFALLYNV